mmetsp:Transcript_22773/g.41187  ORF Transcript_22773/g.41187 Transcript_22773/m.41187 type:complete len:200 (+) Transcript_22773:156-755(+)
MQPDRSSQNLALSKSPMSRYTLDKICMWVAIAGVKYPRISTPVSSMSTSESDSCSAANLLTPPCMPSSMKPSWLFLCDLRCVSPFSLAFIDASPPSSCSDSFLLILTRAPCLMLSSSISERGLRGPPSCSGFSFSFPSSPESSSFSASCRVSFCTRCTASKRFSGCSWPASAATSGSSSSFVDRLKPPRLNLLSSPFFS